MLLGADIKLTWSLSKWPADDLRKACADLLESKNKHLNALQVDKHTRLKVLATVLVSYLIKKSIDTYTIDQLQHDKEPVT